jgi:hypothetical protein
VSPPTFRGWRFLLKFQDFHGIGSSESTRFLEGLVLGNSGNLSPSKRRGLWNSWNEFSKTSNSRRLGILNLRSFEVANLRRSGILNLRSSEVENVGRSGISNLRSFEVANSRRPEVTNLQNHEIGSLRNSGICRRSSSEVTAHEDFLNGEIHESVRRKVKDVISKSPGLVCELMAGL